MGILVFLVFELALRLFGVAAGSSYAPPRLIQVVENGQIQGELVQQSTPISNRSTAVRFKHHPFTAKAMAMAFQPLARCDRFALTRSRANRDTFFWGSAALGQNPLISRLIAHGKRCLSESRSAHLMSPCRFQVKSDPHSPQRPRCGSSSIWG